MTDVRRVQRTLFRMQLDPSFDARLRAGETDARESTGLDEDDLKLLAATDPASVSADLDGCRRGQLLSNVSSEMMLSVAVAVRAGADPELLESFPSSARFHECIASDGRLPLAFAAHAAERAAAADHPLLAAFAALESTMAHARRVNATTVSARSGELVLSPHAQVVELPAGTLAAAAAWRHALDAGDDEPTVAEPDPHRVELVLVATSAPAEPWQLREVRVEELTGLTAALLLAARQPLSVDDRRRFCERHDVEESELEDFAATLAEEGVLLVGPPR